MGTVFMAEQTHPVRRKVALKLIKAGMDTRQVIARFEAERQALALMDHPNIARVLDAGTTGSGRPYFVMELVKGVPITEYWSFLRTSYREILAFPARNRPAHRSRDRPSAQLGPGCPRPSAPDGATTLKNGGRPAHRQGCRLAGIPDRGGGDPRRPGSARHALPGGDRLPAGGGLPDVHRARRALRPIPDPGPTMTVYRPDFGPQRAGLNLPFRVSLPCCRHRAAGMIR
jgi:hypothetical protein